MGSFFSSQENAQSPVKKDINFFLKTVGDAFKNRQGKNYYIVMGNEASDMDSIVSSIVYSIFLQKQQKSQEEVFLPVLNIPREDFSLRTETDYIFGKLGIKKELLLFFPEVEPSFGQIPSENLHFILVDHNKLATSQEKYAANVKEIVDHHKDEALYDLPPNKRVIEMVGSCCTLVAEKVLSDPSMTDPVIIELLLGVILLDTVNLDPKYKKVTPKDETFAKKLSELMQAQQNQVQTLQAQTTQQSLFEVLQEKRFDVSSLSTYDLLRADYKQWKMNQVTVGISSCKRSFEEWFTKDPNISNDCEKLLTNLKLDISFIMTQFMDAQNEMRRELGIYTKNQQLHDEAIAFLKTTDLGLEDSFQEKAQQLSQGGAILSFYNQTNVGASRKQLQPFLDGFYSKK